jgi:hypothetical protein
VRRGHAAWLLWLTLSALTGCGTEGSYALRIVFPDYEASQDTARVSVWVLIPGGRECEQLVAGVSRPAEMGVESSLVVDMEGAAQTMTLEQVPMGNYLFFAEGETEAGAKILRGCTRAEVRTDVNMQVTVALGWSCRPLPGVEIPENERDDDCDGETDE